MTEHRPFHTAQGEAEDLSDSTDSLTQEAIRVLLVDDNEQWVEFLKTDLERQDPSFSVTVALSANEAIMQLQSDDIDVIVADYRMPQTDGIALLNRVRADDPWLPYILITAEGSEEVAAKAIEAGVSDYLVKNPRTDQTQLLSQRIIAAHETYRLQQRLAESEARYRTVTERTREAIGIVHQGTLVFANQRLSEWVDPDRADVTGTDFVECLVDPADQSRIEEAFAAETDTNAPLASVRLLTAQGKRDCEITWAPTTYHDERARLLSIRDVTRQKREERRLRRQRNFNRAIFDQLFTSPTRADIESRAVNQLVTDGFAFVWIGDGTADGVTVTARSTENEYVDILTGSSDITDGGEPAIVAERSGEPQFVNEIESLLQTGWRDTALELGYHSVAGIPLTHQDRHYGVIGIFDTEPHAFDAIEQEYLLEIADTISLAVEHAESQHTLGTAFGVTVDVTLSPDESYLGQVLLRPEFEAAEVVVRVLGTHAGPDTTTVQYLSVSGISLDILAKHLERDSSICDVTSLPDTDPPRLHVRLSEQPIEYDLATRGADVKRTENTADNVDLTFELPDRSRLSGLITDLRENYGSLEIESVNDIDADPEGFGSSTSIDLSVLTEKQSAALAAAVQQGYFKQPRDASATDVAASLGVSHSTFLQHLRAAQQKLGTQLFVQAL